MKGCDRRCELKKKEIVTTWIDASEKVEKLLHLREEEYKEASEKDPKVKDEAINWVTNIGKSVEEAGKRFVEYREQTVSSGQVKKELQAKVDTAYRKRYITRSQHVKMHNAIESATSFDPIFTTSFNEITDSTLRELRINRRDYLELRDKNEGIRQKFNNYRDEVITGIKGATKSQKFERFAGASNNFASGIGKIITAVKGSETVAMDVTGAVLDFANGIAAVLPPPASTVTGAFSSIFAIFGGGDPSNQDVIDEVKKGFKEQRKFISSKFEEQKKFISGKFEEQNKFISSKFGEQTKIISTKIEESTKTISRNIKEKFYDQKMYLFEEFQRIHGLVGENFRQELIRKFDEMQSLASAILIKCGEQLAFLQGYDANDPRINELADSINGVVGILDETKDVSMLTDFIEKYCFPELKTCSSHELKATCLFLVQTYVIVEKQRDIVLFTAMNLLQSTSKAVQNEGYLRVQGERKTFRKTFLRNILMDKRVGCIMTNQWQSDKWQSKLSQKDVLQFIEYIDPELVDDLQEFKNGNKKDFCKQLDRDFYIGKDCMEGKYDSLQSST